MYIFNLKNNNFINYYLTSLFCILSNIPNECRKTEKTKIVFPLRIPVFTTFIPI
ncbi:hypothetical protein [Listeria monocytogenes]|uniref:hypothetical protein n=1 Tax=Listeria monocytogenes TaxID=1639 RepID=UPI001EDEB487|nr:hypothetical protein [Listeria monocytogenes]MCG3304504.1 hypothetical protein [Listeria monocytogenes]